MNNTTDAISFHHMPCRYWDEHVKISYLQRRILVHSILYYELDTNVISDLHYDRMAQQLVRLQNAVPKSEFAKSRYYYAMSDYEGSTGFNLVDRLTPSDKSWLWRIAVMVLEQYNKDRSGNNGP